LGFIAVVSGSCNVAHYTVEKLTQPGGKAVILSDSEGFIHDPSGIEGDKGQYVMEQ
jgi:glutamate dehydrogenase/leucine dehydrogenase